MMTGRFREAEARFDGTVLQVSNGSLAYRWRWTGGGFLSDSIVCTQAGVDYEAKTCAELADWILPGKGRATGKAVLDDIQAARDDDDGFTTPHLCVHAVMTYPDDHVQLRFVVWLYPGIEGLRSQLSIRALDGYAPPQGIRSSGRVARLPLDWTGVSRRLIGYYNDTQNRNETHLDMLREHTVHDPLRDAEHYRWPSILCAESDRGGLALVQESHKCVNQKGHDTGLFRCTPDALELDGWGMLPEEIDGDRWHQAWAAWCVPYPSGDWSRQRALKRFDRTRYPVDMSRDVYTQANTWGSTRPGPAAKEAAREDNVLREIDSQADLGIDIQQIDDGWQGDTYKTFAPDPQRYPEGWGNVVERASATGVGLGLWAPGQVISLEELKASYAEGGFLQYKLDFMNLRNHAQIQELIEKVRAFVEWTGHRVRVNWDVTENPARLGYFFGREFGSIYLANRKDRCPEWVVYRPHTVLRDVWQIARYLNVNRFQTPVQNVDRVDARYSDARLHSHAYCLAIACAGTPLFFQETQHYTAGARNEIREALSLYRKHRDDLYRSLVYPIGSRPDNRSWTGFQWALPERDGGYLLIFRERLCDVETGTLLVNLPADCQLSLVDLVSDERWETCVDTDGRLEMTCKTAPGYRFLSYRY